MKIVVGMNLSPAWVEPLRRAGIQVEHWSSIGPANAPDSTIMEYAAAQGAVVLTHDLDFGAMLAATGHSRPSVLHIRALVLSPEKIGAQVIATLLQLQPELDAGALVTVDVERTRVRLLPLPTPIR